MKKSRKLSAFAGKPIQADDCINAKPSEKRVRFGVGLANGTVRLVPNSADGVVRLRTKLAGGAIRLGEEVAANFRAWFERNFVNPRAGRLGHTSYSRAGVFDDRLGDGMWYAEALDRAWEDYYAPLTASELGYITSHPLIAFQLATGITDTRGVRCMIRGLTLRTNSLQRKAYRSRYYGQENARRRMLAAERRKITKRTTTNPCPTPEAFREVFARVGESVEAKLLFGGMVHDLACYVDSCLRYDGAGNIVGRNGGIKAWLADNVPELYPRYKTIMRYKALAMRLRQAMGVKDPEPTSALLAGVADETSGNKNYSAEKSHHAVTAEVNGNGGGDYCGVGNGSCDNCCKNYGGGGDAPRHRRGLEREYVQERCSRREDQLRQLLDGCGNTLKNVFTLIDAELERMCLWG